MQQRLGLSSSRDRTVPVFSEIMVIGFAFFALGATLAAGVVRRPHRHTPPDGMPTSSERPTCPIVGGLSLVHVCRSVSESVRLTTSGTFVNRAWPQQFLPHAIEWVWKGMLSRRKK